MQLVAVALAAVQDRQRQRSEDARHDRGRCLRPRLGQAGRAGRAAVRQCAGGELIRVDAEHEPELFWALRGGGGNYGIVTAIEFGVVKVHELYAGALFFPVERASEVLHTWNAARLLASNDGGFGNAKTLKPRATT